MGALRDHYSPFPAEQHLMTANVGLHGGLMATLRRIHATVAEGDRNYRR